MEGAGSLAAVATRDKFVARRRAAHQVLLRRCQRRADGLWRVSLHDCGRRGGRWTWAGARCRGSACVSVSRAAQQHIARRVEGYRPQRELHRPSRQKTRADGLTQLRGGTTDEGGEAAQQ